MILDSVINRPTLRVYAAHKRKPKRKPRSMAARVKERERHRRHREAEIAAQIASRSGPAFHRFLVDVRIMQEKSASSERGHAASKYLNDKIRERASAN